MAKTTQHLFGGLNIGMLVTDGFEQVEMTAPRKALEEVGATVKILSARAGKVQGFHHDKKGDAFDVHLSFDKARADDFDALVLPGGTFNADTIRLDPDAQRLVKNVDKEGKPIGMICHGAWLLVSAGLVKGRTLTSWPSLADDVKNAGGHWVDKEVVVDGNWVSSRKPDDLPAFNARFKEVLAQRVKQSVRGTADDVPGAAGMGG